MAHQAEPDDDDDDDLDPMMLVASAAGLVADQAKQHPYRTLGIAFGVGYVLGGGLPRFAVRMAGMAALRLVGQAVLTSDMVVGLARSVLVDGGADESEAMRTSGTSRDSGGRFTS